MGAGRADGCVEAGSIGLERHGVARCSLGLD